MVPSGASTGVHEAWEKRDGDKSRYGGKGVLKAVRVGQRRDRRSSSGWDADRSGRHRPGDDRAGRHARTRADLGANAILGVSLAVAKAAADSVGLPLYRYLGGVGARTLPVPMMNIMNGGKHAAGGTDLQEFMVMPVGAPTFREGLRWGAEIYQSRRRSWQARDIAPRWATRAVLRRRSRPTARPFELILEAVEKAGYKPGEQIMLAMDPAAVRVLRGWQVPSGDRRQAI